MNESKKHFVNQLIAAEPSSLDARGRYEKEVRAMLEKVLSPRQRGVYLLIALLVLAAATFFAVPAVFFPMNASKPGPEGWFIAFISVWGVLTATVLFVLSFLFFRAYWRGVIFQRRARGWAAGLGVVYVGLIGWMFMLAARHTPEMLRDDVSVFGLVLMLYAAVAWIRHGVAQSESRTAEKLLEIELRLAQLADNRMGKAGDSPSAAQTGAQATG
jgi:hypothetical protein